MFGLAAGSLGSHVHTPASTIVSMPSTLTHEEAATTPTVFITVDCAFRHVAACRPGERVLVHAAAGGVGLAAIQTIQSLGATPLATAGSSNKRALVRALGAAHTLGSRDTTFASEACQLGGTDVVLNSLTSPGMVAASLAALAHGGRFVEISKRDIWSPARMALGGESMHSVTFPRPCPNPLSMIMVLSSPPTSNYSSFSVCLLLPSSAALAQSAPTWPTRWWRWTSCLAQLSTAPCATLPPSWLLACCSLCQG